jgi:hypothetical protein
MKECPQKWLFVNCVTVGAEKRIEVRYRKQRHSNQATKTSDLVVDTPEKVLLKSIVPKLVVHLVSQQRNW